VDNQLKVNTRDYYKTYQQKIFNSIYSTNYIKLKYQTLISGILLTASIFLESIILEYT
jgi:hypothetical protein